jgi:hypothetical protein
VEINEKLQNANKIKENGKGNMRESNKNYEME